MPRTGEAHARSRTQATRAALALTLALIIPSAAALRAQASSVDAASRDTESELWLALSTRLEENYQRMRQNGVTIDSNPEPLIVEALRTGAAAAQRAWCTRSGPVCAEILDAFKAAKP